MLSEGMIGFLCGGLLGAYLVHRKRQLRLEAPRYIKKVGQLCQIYYSRELRYSIRPDPDPLSAKVEMPGLNEIPFIEPKSLSIPGALRAALWQLRFRQAQSKFELEELHRLIAMFRLAHDLRDEPVYRKVILRNSIERFMQLDESYSEQDSIFIALGSLLAVCNFTPRIQAGLRLELGQDYEALVHLMHEVRDTTVRLDSALVEGRRCVLWGKLIKV